MPSSERSSSLLRQRRLAAIIQVECGLAFENAYDMTYEAPSRAAAAQRDRRSPAAPARSQLLSGEVGVRSTHALT